MKTTLALFLLAATAKAQGRTIEGTVQETFVERSGSKRPAFVCEGKTDLPEESRLDGWVYFSPFEIGRHLASQAVEVKERKFRIEIPIFPERTLAGTYVIVVKFNPYLQQQKILDALAAQVREYELRLTLTIGTEDEIEKDRLRIYAKLGAEIQSLRSIADAAIAAVKDPMSDGDWRRSMEKWTDQIEATERAVSHVPEYRALGLDDLSEQFMEELGQAVHHVLGSARFCRLSPSDPEAVKVLHEVRKRIDEMIRPVALRLGFEKATSGELAARLPEARKPAIQTLELYRGTIKNPTPDGREYFKAQLALHKKKFQEVALGMTEIAPEKHQEGIRSLMEKGMALFRAAQEAATLEDDRYDTLRELLNEFTSEVEALESALQESP